MFPQGLGDDVLYSGDGGIAPTFLFNASPAHLGAPRGVLVKPPLPYLDNQVSPLRQAKFGFCNQL